ncbi:hypothetical protein PV355_45380, partial [Streptomyces stelliscabiei]|nr:hypothetical protein [Streptomyces stelliscabiei]
MDSTLEGEAHLPWLCLVTGRRGSGKSALLGVLVCATHEDFDKADDAIWLTAFRGDAPSRHDTGHMAAVHARRRSLDAILTSVARQLRVQESMRKWLDESSPARSLCEAIRDLPFPPLLVMDAIDEAESPAEVITELVQPLAERRPDGQPLAYCLVGIRDEEPDHELRATAQQSGLYFDLERIRADTLYTDLREYVLMLLRTEPRYDGVRFKDARPLLAKGVASSLSRRKRPDRGGEFLISGLYTHHILSREWPAFDVKSAEDLGRAVPLDLAGVLKKDLDSGPVQRPMRRPLFTALAHAHGAGMPASVARSVAKLFLTDPVLPELDAVQQALDGEGHYLRVSLDTDGTLLYRLYNQGLDEHLKSGTDSTGGEGRAEGVLDAVLAWAQGLPSALHSIWSTPYVRRHAAQHAADEGRLAELLADPGFLIHTDTDVLGPILARLLPRPTEPHAFLLRLPPARLRDLSFGARRQLFGLEAMRWGAPALSHDLLTAPAHGAPPVRAVPLWSTGTNLDARQLYVAADHTDAVNAAVVLDLDGRQVTISAGADGTIRTADLDDGRPVGEPITGHTSEITALTATTLDGHDGPVLITGSANGPVHLWDLASSGPVGDPLMGHTDEVTAVTTWTAAGKSFLITGSVDGTVRVWQLPGGEPVGDPLMGHTDSVTALAVHTTSEQSFLITGSVDGTVRVWELPSGEPVGDPLMGHTDEVTAVTTWTAAGKSFLITGSV